MQKMIWKHAKFYPLFTTTQPNSNFCAFGKVVGAVHSGQQTIKTRWRFAPWGRLKGGDAAVIETIRTTRRANNSSGRQNVVGCDRRVTGPPALHCAGLNIHHRYVEGDHRVIG